MKNNYTIVNERFINILMTKLLCIALNTEHNLYQHCLYLKHVNFL